MAQNAVAPTKRRVKDIQGMKNVKKKLNDLMILCETEGFLIYSSGERLWSAPEDLDSLLKVFGKYEDCMSKGFQKTSFVVNPLPEANTNLDAKQTTRKQDQNLMRSDVKLKSQVDEDYLLAVLSSFTDDKNFDSLSVELLYELYYEIDSQVRATQANLKPLDFLGNFSKRIKHEKEVKSRQNGMPHVTSVKQEYQLPDPCGKGFYQKENAANEKKNPQSAAVGVNGRSMVDYPLLQSSKDNFSFVLNGKEFESVELRCELYKGTCEEHQDEAVEGTRNRDQNTKERISHLEKKHRAGMRLAGSNASFKKKNGEKIRQVSHLKQDPDKFHLFLSGDQVGSLELIGKLSTKVDNGLNQETTEDEWLDLKL